MKTTESGVARRIRVDYFDQNEAFAPLLPRSGELIGNCTDVHGNADWFLVRLDAPLDYQLKVGEPFQFRPLHAEHFLIRSRWAGYPVGGAEATSVFVLLVEDPQARIPEPFDPKSYVHAAWGTCVAEA